MRGFGVVSFNLSQVKEDAIDFLENKMFTLMGSLVE
jgi:hypothetical protein